MFPRFRRQQYHADAPPCLKYETEGSVQVNGSAWVPLIPPPLPCSEGGRIWRHRRGFATLDMTVPLPSGAIVAGNNTIQFPFIGTDGRTAASAYCRSTSSTAGQLSGALDCVRARQPTTWQPPFTDAADIAAGQLMAWSGSDDAASTGPVPIQANCMSCHTQDGRDLKYFIIPTIRSWRVVFHGLTTQQGQQIASYIRTLQASNPAGVNRLISRVPVWIPCGRRVGRRRRPGCSREQRCGSAQRHISRPVFRIRILSISNLNSARFGFRFR